MGCQALVSAQNTEYADDMENPTSITGLTQGQAPHAVIPDSPDAPSSIHIYRPKLM